MSSKPSARSPLLLVFAAACVSSSQVPQVAPADPCVVSASPIGEVVALAVVPDVPIQEDAAARGGRVRPGRYWFRNGECSALDVRVVDDSAEQVLEIAARVAGGVHSSPGAYFYLARASGLVGGGFRDEAGSLDSGCTAPGALDSSAEGPALGGVHLFVDKSSCEEAECTGNECLARFELGDCAGAVQISARRLRALRHADQAARQRTLARFGRIGRRGRLWRAGESQCVAVRASRDDDGTLELRYAEPVEGGEAVTTEVYGVSPIDLRASLHSFTTIFSPSGGGLGGIGTASGGGVPLYFGDGVVLLGRTDLFFEQAACESQRASSPIAGSGSARASGSIFRAR